jgi:threonine/homoserine/homoserine lactone efflux protein
MDIIRNHLAELPALNFWLGYVALICVPGPNMLIVGTRAASAGFRHAVPLVLAVACGAAALATALHVLISFAFDDTAQRWLTPLGGVFMLVIAWRIMNLSWSCGSSEQARGHARHADMAIAFVCGATNPSTIMFFMAYFLGMTTDPDPLSASLIFSCTFLCCLTVLSGATALVSLKQVRTRIADNFTPIKLVCAACVVGFGSLTLWSGLERLMTHG